MEHMHKPRIRYCWRTGEWCGVVPVHHVTGPCTGKQQLLKPIYHKSASDLVAIMRAC